MIHLEGSDAESTTSRGSSTWVSALNRRVLSLVPGCDELGLPVTAIVDVAAFPRLSIIAQGYAACRGVAVLVTELEAFSRAGVAWSVCPGSRHRPGLGDKGFGGSSQSRV